MEYLKNYDIIEQQIQELKDKYNDGIINFLISEEDFIIEKLEYLKKRGYKLFPILNNNIKIFLEEMKPLQNKIEKMKNKGYSKKSIQIVLMNEKLYNKE